MDKKYRNILKNAREPLVTDMDARMVLQKMSDSLVFTEGDEEDIKNMPDGQKQNEQLLETLQKKATDAYFIFRKTIQELYPHLIDLLPETGK